MLSKKKKFISLPINKVICDNCTEKGFLVVRNNIPDKPYVNTICNNCGTNRQFKVDTRKKSKSTIRLWVKQDLGLNIHQKAQITGPASGTKRKDEEEDINCLDRGRLKSGRRKHDMKNMEDPLKNDEILNAKHVKYLDVLAYVLDDDGIPKDEPAVKGSDFIDSKHGHARIEDNTEDAAPKDGFKHSITPEEKLKYRNYSKPLQSTCSVERGHIVLDKDNYIPLEVFTEKDNAILSNNSKKELFLNSLTEDTKLQKQSGKSSSVYVEPCGSQWCPKIRKAIAFHICSQYCIDGRRVPQTEKEFETYQDYLVEGGDNLGYVFCGYKDWLKREVDAFYPGWVEDHILKAGGEISKNTVPYQHKMNLEPGQRRTLEQYPYMKSTEKRLQEKNHVYDHELKVSKTRKNIISSSSLKKKV